MENLKLYTNRDYSAFYLHAPTNDSRELEAFLSTHGIGFNSLGVREFDLKEHYSGKHPESADSRIFVFKGEDRRFKDIAYFLNVGQTYERINKAFFDEVKFQKYLEVLEKMEEIKNKFRR